MKLTFNKRLQELLLLLLNIRHSLHSLKKAEVKKNI